MQNGFQLIEMMIVVVIVGVLSVIVYPNFNQHFVTTHRLQAQKALLDLASRLEQYQLVHQSYQDATFAALNVEEFTEGKHYRLMLELEENSYLLSAVPQSYDECRVLTLNSIGQRSGKKHECWS